MEIRKELEEEVCGVNCNYAEIFIRRIQKWKKNNCEKKMPMYIWLILRYYSLYQREKIISKGH